MEERRDLIITETHRLLTEEQKRIMGVRNLSFTTMPTFIVPASRDIVSVEDYRITASNVKALRYDNLSHFELSQIFKRDHNGDLISLINSFFRHDDGSSKLLLAQDNDYGGNLMANLIYRKLVDGEGYDPSRIKRVVGIEFVFRNGIECLDLYFGTFYHEELFCSILNRIQKERNFTFSSAKKEDVMLMGGYRNIVALRSVLGLDSSEEITRISKGTSIAGYITNGLLEE